MTTLFAVMSVLLAGEAATPDNAQAIATVLIALFGGGGGIVIIIKAFLDHREKVMTLDDNIDARMNSRLENQLASQEKRNEQLLAKLDEEKAYTANLVFALAKAGLPIPPRQDK